MRARLSSWLFIVVSGTALAQGADVGLVNMVSGEVTFVPLAGTPGSVRTFMRVRDGDRVTVAPGAQVRVVFFQGARQERWAGPASFRAGEKAGEPISGKSAEVVTLPAGVPQRIARVPDLLQNARLGGMQLRGGHTPEQRASLAQQDALREARKTYDQILPDFPSDDITPELYLYAALHEYLLYDEMKAAVTAMLRKQPNNEDVKALDSWVNSRLGRQ